MKFSIINLKDNMILMNSVQLQSCPNINDTVKIKEILYLVVDKIYDYDKFTVIVSVDLL